jgi:CRISPR system Cascade subunit CasC
MLIEIHAIQNHSPGNLNRDDLGAPKTCYFGGVMRSRISSQCIKRSIRMSEQFNALLAGVATRRLAQLIAGDGADLSELKRAISILETCGISPKEEKNANPGARPADDKSAGRVYTTRDAVRQMSVLFKNNKESDRHLATEFAKLIATETTAPDMALCGRMLEPKRPKKERGAKSGTDEERETSNETGVWKGLDLTVEAALQVAHAISTHEARPEVDYFVAADDIPGPGAAYVDEAMFASACFYKYFSIHWETLVANLAGREPDVKKEPEAHAKWVAETKPRAEKLAAHTVGAFLRGAALTNPTGKQNSFAAHNPPDGIVVEFKDTSPVSYANAFASPVPCKGPRDIIAQSMAQLDQYIHDLDVGYGRPCKRFWFSPNLRYKLTDSEGSEEQTFATNIKSLDDLVAKVVREIGFDWDEVQKVTVCEEALP